jgi:hypothetical protein
MSQPTPQTPQPPASATVPRSAHPNLQFAISAVALIVIGLGVLAGGPAFPLQRPAEGDYARPVLALEMMHTPTDVTRLLGPPAAGSGMRAGLARAIRWDYGFIVSYVLLFVVIGVYICKRTQQEGGPRARALGVAVAVVVGVAALAAAGFDVAENRAMLAALSGTADASAAPRPSALAKWGALFTAMLGVTLAFTPPVSLFRRAIGYTAALFCLLSGMVGLAGLALHKDQMVAGAASYVAIVLPLGAIYFATVRVLERGLGDALDRLGRTRLGFAVATWPSEDPFDLDASSSQAARSSPPSPPA